MQRLWLKKQPVQMKKPKKPQPPVDETLEKVKLGLHPGAVYLLHPESTTNTAMLGDMIDWIRSVGYEILPICDIE